MGIKRVRTNSLLWGIRSDTLFSNNMYLIFANQSVNYSVYVFLAFYHEPIDITRFIITFSKLHGMHGNPKIIHYVSRIHIRSVFHLFCLFHLFVMLIIKNLISPINIMKNLVFLFIDYQLYTFIVILLCRKLFWVS